MSQGKLDHFPDLGHLLPAAANIVVSDIVCLLLIFSFDGLAVSEHHGRRCHDAELSWFRGYHLELHCLEAASHDEQVAPD